jgi:hypothetical protein
MFSAAFANLQGTLRLRTGIILFKIPFSYDLITKLCRQQAQGIQNIENSYIQNIGQGEAQNRKYKRITFGGGQAFER